MAKVYNEYDRLQMLNDLFDEKFEQKDYLNALLTVNSIEKSGATDVEVCLKRARVFFAMERYSQSADEWFKYLTLVKNEKSYAKAYNGLGACFYKMGDEKVAGYYFNRQIMSNKKGVYDYSYVTAEFFEEMLSADKNYYLAYPYDKADFTKTLERAEDHLKGGDYQGAIKLLEEIPKTSKYYATSLVTSSIGKYFQGDVKGAFSDIEESLRIEKSVIAVCNAISMYTAEGNTQKADEYLKVLQTQKIEDAEDVYKVSMIYCERGDDKTAKSFAQKYLKQNPYDASMLLLYGMMNYNLKDYNIAENSFKKAYQITGGYIAKYYLKLAEKRELTRFEYTYDLQTSDKLKVIKKLTSIMKASPDDRVNMQSEIYELTSYAFSSTSYQLQSTIITLLGELATEISISLMKKALISINVYDRIKAGILGFLTADGFDGELGAVFGNVYRKIRFYKAVFDSEDTVFTEAYAFVFAKLAPMETEMEAIKISAENIYNKLKEKGLLKEVLDVKSLSAVIYELSAISKIKSRREFAEFFEGNLREIKRIKSLLE